MSSIRQTSQFTLGSFINESVFAPRGAGNEPAETKKTYRVLPHQRFPAWSLPKKQLLVDSVLSNYPIHGFILMRHQDPSGEEFYSVEDGQTRMTALQEFLKGEFACEPGSIGNGCTFTELPASQQEAFKSYQVTVEIYRNSAKTAEVMPEIFARLNSGKPLGDNDKYHSRMEISPVLKFMVTLKNHPELREDFGVFVGPIGTGKSRKLLGDMVGAILAISTRYDENGGYACLNTSYELNHKHLNMTITAAQSADVVAFFRAYFAKLHEAIDTATQKPQKKYGKISGALGLAGCAWVRSGEIPVAVSWYVQKMFYDAEYEPSTFSRLSTGDKRNCQNAAIRNRLEMIEKQWRMDVHGEVSGEEN
jgi:hypothetical protein